MQTVYRQIPEDLAMATFVYAPEGHQGRLGFDADDTGARLLQALTAGAYYFDHDAHRWKSYPTQGDSLIRLLRKYISPSILAAPSVIQQHIAEAEAFDKANRKFALSMRYGLTPSQWHPMPGAIKLFNRDVGLLDFSAGDLMRLQIDAVLEWRHGEFGLHAYLAAVDHERLDRIVKRVSQFEDIDLITYLREEDFPRW